MITLLQFTDKEIEDKYDLVSSMILYHLKHESVQKISGRQCKILDIDNQTAIDFLNENHIQGYEKGSIKKGLFYKNELVSCLIAAKPRYSRNFDLEIIRFCTRRRFQVRGGFSKMIRSLRRSVVLWFLMRIAGTVKE
jgi:hypothetical protein